MVEIHTSVRCPSCGTELSQERWSAGLCPACLIELALDESSLEAELRVDPSEAPTLQFTDGSFAEGEIHGDRYRIRSLLGRGGMGEVWRAYDLKLRQEVALKALRSELIQDAGALGTLRQEVRVAREVVSPNVCRVYDLEELDGEELVSMEYIDGTTLQEILTERSPLALDEAREIASQFLAGLEAIHDAGLVHRDIKPENVMVTRTGRVVVMDFGVAKGLGDSKGGVVAGTPAYMSPEAAKGGELDARADVFSAGVMLAEMVEPEGVPSFDERRRVWESIHQESRRVSETPWSKVITQAIDPNPDERFVGAAALARALEEVTLRAAGDEEARPYPGLSAFQQEDARFFFGRELEVEALWKKLRRPHLLALIGPSGAGKSSFLRAGLLPTLTDGWRAIVTTPGDRPFGRLARALGPELGDAPGTQDLLERLEEPEVAVELLSEWRRGSESALLIVDQFEELFTQNPPEVQERFAALLGRLPLEADLHVLISMRDDFLLHCSDLDSLAPVFSELSPLKSLSGASLRRALVEPALRCGYRFEEESMVEAMLAEVEGERGALPMVAFTAARLWEERDRESGFLTREAYEAIGGVGGALAQHAETTLEQIGPDRIPIVRELFRNLVTARGTRVARDREELLSVFGSNGSAGTETGRFDGRTAPAADVGEGLAPSRAPARGAPTADQTIAADVLDTLIDARLLTSYEVPADEEGASPHHRIEIVHESLLTHWPRLVRWQMQDAEGAKLRDELRHQAGLWVEKGRPDDLLWTGTSYKEYELWRERYPGGLTTNEEEFARAMTAHAERRKRQRRLAVAAVIALLATGLTIVGGLWRRSERSEQEARAEALRAEASKLLALGQLELDDSPTSAVAYALASLELTDTPEARRFALEALWRGPTALILSPNLTQKSPDGIGYWSHRVGFSPDGDWFAVAGWPGRGQLWSSDGQTHRAFHGHEGEPSSWPRVTFGQNSDLLLSGAGKTIRSWSVPETREIRTLEFGQPTWFQILGAELFTFTRVDEGRYQIQSRPLTGGEPKSLGHVEGSRMKLDPLGRWLAYAGGRILYIVSLQELSTAQLRVVGRHEEPIAGTAWAPKGDRIASVDESGEIRIWSLASGSTAPLRVLEIPEPSPWMAFDPSGSLLAARGGRTTVLLWDLTGPPDAEPMVLRLGGDRERTAEFGFHPSGQWLASAHQTDVAFWPLRRCYSDVLARWGTEESPGLAFAGDGSWLAEAWERGGPLQLRPLSAAAGGEVRILLEEGLGTWPQIEVHPDSERLVVPGSSGRLWLVPLDGSEPRAMATGFSSNLQAVVLDPRGHRAAVAADINSPAAEKAIRVVDLESGEVQVLGPPEGVGDGAKGVTYDMGFTSNGGLLSRGTYGLVLWNLEDGSAEVLERGPAEGITTLAVSPDGRLALVTRQITLTPDGPQALLALYDLENGGSRDLTSHGQRVTMVTLDPTGEIVVTGDLAGTIRVGPIDGGEPHLLLGHQSAVVSLDLSPDGRWLASSSMDSTGRLWPMPDMERPPFHTLPYEELLAKLRSLTNLRAVEDPTSPTGYKIEPGPFPGWEEVPTW